MPDPAPLADRRARQREEMVKLAVSIMEEDGLAGLQARRLAERSGCAVGTVYNLFADLDGVIFAANEVSLREISAACERAVREAGSAPDARLLALARAYAAFAIAHPRRFDALFTHRAPKGREFPAAFQQTLDALFALLNEVFGGAATTMPLSERGLAARALWASVHGIVSLGLQDRVDLIAREEIMPAIEDVVGAAAKGLAR